MKNKTINGLAVRYTDNGENPLVFVHAFPLSSEMWENQISAFNSDYNVMTYDVRGLGKSTQSDNQFMMETYADDLIDIISDLKLEKVNAVGLSMGGYIIQKALLKNPDLFKTVILADTRLDRDSNEALSARAASIQKIKSGQRKDFLDSFTGKLVSKDNFTDKDLMFKINSLIVGNSDDGICGALLALATRPENTGAFKDFKLPALIIVGEHDSLTPVEAALKIKDEFINSEIHVIKDSGHLSNLENPAEFNSTLKGFLEKHNK
ncbi:MAG: alpha/beta hydrolase [Candidatus Kapaibacterium sp.]